MNDDIWKYAYKEFDTVEGADCFIEDLVKAHQEEIRELITHNLILQDRVNKLEKLRERYNNLARYTGAPEL